MSRPIVTLTMNPCIDLNLEVDEIVFDKPLRAKAERRRAGGKGINVSEALAVLGVPSVAVAPLGGHSGHEFEDLAGARLNPDFVQLKPIPIKEPTRTNTVISEAGGRHIKVNQRGPALAENDVQRVVDLLDRLIDRDAILAVCGSMPPGLDPAFYGRLVGRYRQRGCFVVLDADGEAFRIGLNAKPNLVKPNRQELAEWFGASLESDEEFQRAISQLIRTSEGLCLATDGPNPAYLASPTELWTASPAPACGSPVGAGDCSLAGLVSCLWRTSLQDLSFDSTLRFALACGTASASRPDTEGLCFEDLRWIESETAKPQKLDLKL
jgi:1-phosphofructokinase family hexose kinase